jgi:hypothetical protein
MIAVTTAAVSDAAALEEARVRAIQDERGLAAWTLRLLEWAELENLAERERLSPALRKQIAELCRFSDSPIPTLETPTDAVNALFRLQGEEDEERLAPEPPGRATREQIDAWWAICQRLEHRPGMVPPAALLTQLHLAGLELAAGKQLGLLRRLDRFFTPEQGWAVVSGWRMRLGEMELTGS